MNDRIAVSDAASDAVSDGVNDIVNDAAVTGGSGRVRAAETEPAADGGVTSERGSTRRRRRVVALSPRDQERVARGQRPEDLARADYEHDALSGPAEGLDALLPAVRAPMTPASDATCPLTGADRPGGDGGPMGEACRLAGVHGADINPASALHAEDKPQHSNDSHWAFRWRDR